MGYNMVQRRILKKIAFWITNFNLLIHLKYFINNILIQSIASVNII